jgi:hypothetical protein
MLTFDDAYEITRAAVQRVSLARTVRPETQVYGPVAEMDSLDMVGAVVDIEGKLAERGINVTLSVGDLAGTVTVADFAQYVLDLVNG